MVSAPSLTLFSETKALDLRAVLIAFKASEEASVSFDQPLSMANTDLLHTLVTDMKLYLQERTHKGYRFYTVYKSEPSVVEIAPQIQPVETLKPENENHLHQKKTRNDEGSSVVIAAAPQSSPSIQSEPLDQLAQIRAEKAKQFAEQKKKPKPAQANPAGKQKRPQAVIEKEKKFREMSDDDALEAALAELYAVRYSEPKSEIYF